MDPPPRNLPVLFCGCERATDLCVWLNAAQPLLRAHTHVPATELCDADSRTYRANSRYHSRGLRVNADWAIYPNFLSAEIIAALALDVCARWAADSMHRAGVGHGVGNQSREDVRGDTIDWLEESEASFKGNNASEQGVLASS